jgi:DNA-binding CsgD family transcriptional regulator
MQEDNDKAVKAENEPEPEPPADRPFGLTRRECEVLELVALGCSDGEVAQRLFIARATVGDHMKTVRRKTRTVTRAHAVAQYFAARLSAHDGGGNAKSGRRHTNHPAASPDILIERRHDA